MILLKFLVLLDYAKLARKQQENRGMSGSHHILGSGGIRRLSHHSKYSPPIVDDIILDSRSPTTG